MQHELETEFKFMLTKEEFEALVVQCDAWFSKRTRYIQINHYYDTENQTYVKQGVTIRVRQKEDRLKLQIKKHRTTGDAFHVSDEYEKPISALPVRFPHPDTGELLIHRGSLITERRAYSFGHTGTVCLDCNLYLGVHDYEVELEVQEEDRPEALEWIRRWQLKTPSKNGKASRFFCQYQRYHSLESV